MRRCFVWMYPLLFAACGLSGPTQMTPVNPKEDFAINEVKRLAEKLGKPSIKGSMSDTGRNIPAGQAGCPADVPKGYCISAAWFMPPEGPVVFFREWVNRESVTLVDLTNTAAHEVCHSLTLQHDALLYNCIRSLGADPQFQPTEHVLDGNE
jgi:hypothetical protein